MTGDFSEQAPVEATRVDVARRVLAELGVTAATLAVGSPVVRMPTSAEYAPRPSAAATPAIRASYSQYGQCAIDRYGERRLDEIRSSDILALQQHVVTTVQPRHSSRGGRHAGEHLVRALRNLYQLAVHDELIPAQYNPGGGDRVNQ